MAIYIFFLLLFAVAAFIIKNKEFALMCILGLFIVAIFRAETVGLDTVNYIKRGIYEDATGLKTQQFIYVFLSSLLPRGGGHILVVTFAIFTFWGIIASCKRFGVMPSVAFFFFIIFEYFNLSLNICRQYAAAGILLIAFTFLFEKSKKKYLYFFWVLIAFGIHSASLICVPLYFLRYVNFSKIKDRYIIAFFAAIYVVYHLVLKDYYLTLMQTVELTEDIETYAHYFEQADNFQLSLGGLIIAVSMQLLSIYIFMKLRREKSDKVRILSSFLFISILLDIFFSELYGNIGRIRFSINIINILAYSYYILNYKDKYKKIVALLVFVIYGYSYISLLTGEAYGTTPYRFDFWLF